MGDRVRILEDVGQLSWYTQQETIRDSPLSKVESEDENQRSTLSTGLHTHPLANILSYSDVRAQTHPAHTN